MTQHNSEGVTFEEIDGIPAMWPAKGLPGPAAGRLSFRVGQADETLQTRGFTHLVEHLALFPTGQAAHAYNGWTGPTTTSFGMEGSPGDLIDFFGALGRSLQDLPFHRIDLERGVLAAEERSSGSAVDTMFRLRWGPRGFGLLAYPEFGAQRAQNEDLRQWSAQWFTKQNAVLTLSAPPPRDLRISLPDGAWTAPPDPETAIEALPMSYTQHGEWFGCSVVRERVAGGNESAWLLSERLNRNLRHKLGLVYGVQGTSLTLSARWRHDVYWTNALPEQLFAAGSALVDTLAEAGEPMNDSERSQWAALRARAIHEMSSPDALATYVSYVSEQVLLGGATESREQLEDLLQRTTEADVLACLRQSLERLVLAVPESVDTGRVAAALPIYSTSELRGRTIDPAHGQPEDLILADAGLTLRNRTSGDSITVRFDDLAGVLAWDDGARTLLGYDGFAVAYTPEAWRAPPSEVIRHIDARIDPRLCITQGERTAAPPPKRQRAGRKPQSRGLLVLRTVLAVFWISNGLSTLLEPELGQSRFEQLFQGSLLIGLSVVAGWAPVGLLWRSLRSRLS